MHRILHAAASFFIVAVAYWTYAATIVPLVEPQRAEAGGKRTSRTDLNDFAAPESKYAPLFAGLFPPDHWTRTSPPKVIEVGQGMFVLQDYETHKDGQTQDEGRIKIKPSVLIYFPTPWSRSAGPPPRDAIVLEAPEGMIAELDGPIKFVRGKEFHLENAWLTGPVTIRSDMDEEGPQDDLYIQTRDVLLNDRGIWSDRDVAVRLGPHTGSGQKLDIRFLPGGKGGSGSGFEIGGVQSIQLLRHVRLSLQQDERLADGSLGLTGTQSSSASGGATQRQIELSCDGPLFVNVPAQTAEFDHNVQVFLHGNGPSDSLTCETLKVVFADRLPSKEGGAASDTGVANAEVLPPSGPIARSGSASPAPLKQHATLEPILFEAKGQPVTIHSPLREIRGQCRRLLYDVRRAHLVLEAQAEPALAAPRPHSVCQLVYGRHHLYAPRVEYTLDGDDPRGRLGTLRVAGPGWLTSLAERQEQGQDQELKATWQESLQLIRQDGVPILSLFGRPEINVPGTVRIAAGDFHVWLKEEIPPPPGGAARQAAGSREQQIQVVPERVFARQSVEIDSPQVTARVGQLEAWIIAADATQSATDEPQHRGAAQGARSRPLLTPAQKDAAKSRYVEADRLQIRALLPGRQDRGMDGVQLTHLTLLGSVLFEERTEPTQSTPPVWVRSDWLDVADAHTAAMTLRATGQPVVAHANGTTLRGGEIRFDQANGRFDVPTPGEIALAISRDLEGRPLDAPRPLTISWHGTLRFDGRQAVMTDRVHVRTPEEQLRTQQLTASLKTPVPLSDLQWKGQLEFEKLACTGGVVLDRQTFDAGGLASEERAEVPNLTIERSLGQIYAAGPGWLRSVQLERGDSLRPARAQGTPPATFGARTPHRASRPPGTMSMVNSAPRVRGAAGLIYLRVDFQREMRGNLDRREIAFDGQVHCVRGPVKSWDESLHVERLPQLPEDTVVLDAATLRINQWKRDRQTWYGMEAEGSVEVEGGLRGGSIFSARGSRLTYDQSKDLLILHGGAGVANLVLEESLGGNRHTCQARLVQFWPSRPEMVGHDFLSMRGDIPP